MSSFLFSCSICIWVLIAAAQSAQGQSTQKPQHVQRPGDDFMRPPPPPPPPFGGPYQQPWGGDNRRPPPPPPVPRPAPPPHPWGFPEYDEWMNDKNNSLSAAELKNQTSHHINNASNHENATSVTYNRIQQLSNNTAVHSNLTSAANHTMAKVNSTTFELAGNHSLNLNDTSSEEEDDEVLATSLKNSTVGLKPRQMVLERNSTLLNETVISQKNSSTVANSSMATSNFTSSINASLVNSTIESINSTVMANSTTSFPSNNSSTTTLVPRIVVTSVTQRVHDSLFQQNQQAIQLQGQYHQTTQQLDGATRPLTAAQSTKMPSFRAVEIF